MTFAEAHAAMRKLVGPNYFTVQVESTDHDGAVEICWRGYFTNDSRDGTWTAQFQSPQAMLEDVARRLGILHEQPPSTLESIGDPAEVRP